jgi:hypothetical protein
MRLAAALLLVCLLLPGCRHPGDPAPYGLPPARVGPSLDRLYAVLSDRGASEAQKTAYWRSVQGTLVNGRGTVLRVSDRLEVECPLQDGSKVRVTATPSPAAASGLSELKEGEAISVLGRLSEKTPDKDLPAGYVADFELTDARITIPMR